MSGHSRAGLAIHLMPVYLYYPFSCGNWRIALFQAVRVWNEKSHFFMIKFFCAWGH